MHATLLAVLLMAGPQQHCGDCRPQPTVVVEDCHCGNCSRSCGHSNRSLGGIGCRAWGMFWGRLATCCGSKPRTSCATQIGCCPGDNTHLQHYPAFYGSRYRQAYNYRHLFDYPWHPTPPEPYGSGPYW